MICESLIFNALKWTTLQITLEVFNYLGFESENFQPVSLGKLNTKDAAPL